MLPQKNLPPFRRPGPSIRPCPNRKPPMRSLKLVLNKRPLAKIWLHIGMPNATARIENPQKGAVPPIGQWGQMAGVHRAAGGESMPRHSTHPSIQLSATPLMAPTSSGQTLMCGPGTSSYQQPLALLSCLDLHRAPPPRNKWTKQFRFPNIFECCSFPWESRSEEKRPSTTQGKMRGNGGKHSKQKISLKIPPTMQNKQEEGVKRKPTAKEK